MGLLDDIKKQGGDALGGGDNGSAALVSAVIAMIQKTPGGLGGLLEQFKQKGLGDAVGSWIGTGSNDKLTPQDVQLALGANRIDELSKASGQPPGVTSEKLAAIIPQVVDKLTPAGVLPEGGILDQGLDFLKSKL